MIVLGRIVAPFGVQGWLRVHAFGDDPLAWKKMQRMWLSRDAEAAQECWQSCKLEDLRPHGDGLVVRLEGVADRNAAEALAGQYVGAPRTELPATGSDEYYWADLVGLDVVNMQEQCLGRVESLIETGANQVLVTRDGERERLLPFVAQVVKSVDLPQRRIRVDWGGDW